MAPEMALSYVIGTIPSLTVTVLHFWLHKKKITSKPFLQLQRNLQGVQKYWCESQGKILDLTEDAIAKDDKNFRKTLKVMGTIFFFLSWFGFFFNLIILISIHSIAISRYEKKIFNSALCEDDLSFSEVENVLKDFVDL
jgi:hypothetical protein